MGAILKWITLYQWHYVLEYNIYEVFLLHRRGILLDIRITVFWDVTLRSLVYRHRHFVGLCCLHLQDTRFLLLLLWRWRHRWKKGTYDMNKKRNFKMPATGLYRHIRRHKRPAGAYRIMRTGYPSTLSVSTCDRARGTNNIFPIQVDCREPNALTLRRLTPGYSGRAT